MVNRGVEAKFFGDIPALVRTAGDPDGARSGQLGE
jgi:hypothetical protein